MFDKQKAKLIDELKASGISDSSVLHAMLEIPREDFVLKKDIESAYKNCALPIQSGQTISQPLMIALMTQALTQVKGMKKVLEIGTGSGYQSAILAKIFPEIFTIERIEALYNLSNNRLKALNLNKVNTLFGDGYEGWASQSPFDGILVTAAPESIPANLLEQLNPDGGRLVIPVGYGRTQDLKIIDRHHDSYKEQIIDKVLFVPLLPGTQK